MRRGLWLAAGLALAGGWLSLGPVTDWLVAPEEPEPAELLIILAGGSGERFRTGLDLYRAGLSPRILVTDRYGFPDRSLRRLREGGVPDRSLMAPPRPSESTYEDALTIRQVILREKVKSILVVTSPYHCRRARLILRRVLGGLGVKVVVTPSVTLYMDLGRWWRSRQGWLTVPWELPKLIWAWATVPDFTSVGGAVPAK